MKRKAIIYRKPEPSPKTSKWYQLLGVKNKTLWDWASLLFVPLVLVVGAYFLDETQVTC